MIIIFNVQTLFSLIASLAVALGGTTQTPVETVSVDQDTEVQSFTEVEETNNSDEVVPEIELNNMFSSEVESEIDAAIEAEKEKQEASGNTNTTITSTQETSIEKEERDAQDAADAAEEPQATTAPENQAKPNDIKVDSSSDVDVNKILKKIDVDLDF